MQLAGGVEQDWLQCTSHWAFACVTQSVIGFCCMQVVVSCWSHSPWQPARQLSAFGLHTFMQVDSHGLEQAGSGVTVQAPLQPTSSLSGVQSAVQPPLTSILQSIP
jgi:hypothetical protein